MKKILSVLAASLLAVLFTGCARKLIVEETLQMPPHAKIYTAYNLWYDEENKIQSINYQKGHILSFGTQVEILSATEDKVKFRDVKTKKEFTITYQKQYRMMSPENYLRSVFTMKDMETLTEGIPPANMEKIKRGIVEKGMTKEEVRLAYGPPCAFKTPQETLDTWVFWTEYLIGRRLVFNNNKLTDIIEI